MKPDIYDPELNPLYRDMLKHYGVVGLPCRVRDPNRKGKVESSVAHAQKSFRGRKFEVEDEHTHDTCQPGWPRDKSAW